MTKPVPGAKTDPSSVPTASHGGSNKPEAGKSTGAKEGHGGQKHKATKQKK